MRPSTTDFLRLTTMYSPPRLPDPPLRRERLTERLRGGVQDTPLTLVSGLAGSGKTTLAADWMEDPGVPWRVVWLTLSEAGEFPEDFWFFVTEALRRAGVELPHSAGVQARQPAGDDLVIRLATDLLDRDEPVVLVLDEVERLPVRTCRDSWSSCCGWSATACVSCCSAGSTPCSRCSVTGWPAP